MKHATTGATPRRVHPSDDVPIPLTCPVCGDDLDLHDWLDVWDTNQGPTPANVADCDRRPAVAPTVGRIRLPHRERREH